MEGKRYCLCFLRISSLVIALSEGLLREIVMLPG
jgi:hypothetical protein